MELKVLETLPTSLSILVVVFLLLREIFGYLKMQEKKDSGGWVDLREIRDGVNQILKNQYNFGEILSRLSLIEDKQSDINRDILMKTVENEKSLTRIESKCIALHKGE